MQFCDKTFPSVGRSRFWCGGLYGDTSNRSKGREVQMLYRMSSHLLSGKAERVTAFVDGMRKE